MQNPPIAIGDHVRVRRDRWRVTAIQAYGNCRLLVLHGVGRGNRISSKRVLLPFERVEPALATRRTRVVGGKRWRRECRRVIAECGGADALRCAETARIDLLPYQLAPALAVVRGATSRLLIADDVGLGKTVQAGLIVSELVRRGAAERVLILTPAGLREQWLGELHERFALPFALVDAAAIQQRRAGILPDTNPWATFPRVVASLDYVKRPEILPLLGRCRWDLVIIDEAHGAVAGDRYQAVSQLASRAGYVLLLTATPHSGDSGAYGNLRGIGHRDDPLLVFRRTRKDVGMKTDRRVSRLNLTPTLAEREMHVRLEAFAAAVLADHGEHRPDVWLALAILQKRALSSAFALLETVGRRLHGLTPGATERQPQLPFEAEEGEYERADEAPAWTCPPLHSRGVERALLVAVAESAAAALPTQAKVAALHRLLARVNEPILVFTEYRDTLLHLRETVLASAAAIHGGLSRKDRRAALDTFERGERPVLLATDAVGEGLNLHRTCRLVINFELPWNPMRLEQRIGRVDRIGQNRRVHAIHLVLDGSAESGLLARLGERLARARVEIGIPDPLGTQRRTSDPMRATPTDIDVSAEHGRLQQVRRLSDSRLGRPGAAAGRGDTLVARARRRTRRLVSSGPLAIVRTTLAHEDGGLIHEGVEAISLVLQRRLSRTQREELEGLIAQLRELISTAGREGDDTPLSRSIRIHSAFWRRRLERERAIERAAAHHRVKLPQQAGLFQPRSSSPPDRPFGAEDPGRGLEIAERALREVSASVSIPLLLVP